MTEKTLGKIESIKLGVCEGRFGLHVTLAGGGLGVCDFKGCWDPATMSWSGKCQWTEDCRMKTLADLCVEISHLLDRANVSYLHQLEGKPIEWTHEDGQLKEWRILTEVI